MLLRQELVGHRASTSHRFCLLKNSILSNVKPYNSRSLKFEPRGAVYRSWSRDYKITWPCFRNCSCCFCPNTCHIYDLRIEVLKTSTVEVGKTIWLPRFLWMYRPHSSQYHIHWVPLTLWSSWIIEIFVITKSTLMKIDILISRATINHKKLMRFAWFLNYRPSLSQISTIINFSLSSTQLSTQWQPSAQFTCARDLPSSQTANFAKLRDLRPCNYIHILVSQSSLSLSSPTPLRLVFIF